MHDLTLEETVDDLTYTSSNGVIVIVRKVGDVLDVRQITPNAVSGMTWQQLQAHLADRVDA